MRQAAGNRPDDVDAMSGKIPSGAGRYRADHGDKRPGNAGRKPVERKDAADHQRGETQRRQVYPGQTAGDLSQLL